MCFLLHIFTVYDIVNSSWQVTVIYIYIYIYTYMVMGTFVNDTSLTMWLVFLSDHLVACNLIVRVCVTVYAWLKEIFT